MNNYDNDVNATKNRLHFQFKKYINSYFFPLILG